MSTLALGDVEQLFKFYDTSSMNPVISAFGHVIVEPFPMI
jgi:hypothetical protein